MSRIGDPSVRQRSGGERAGQRGLELRERGEEPGLGFGPRLVELGADIDIDPLVIRDQRPNTVAVLADSPAAKAGLKEHDIITHLDGHEIEPAKDLMDMLQKHKVGDTLAITVLRDAKPHELSVTLEERT